MKIRFAVSSRLDGTGGGRGSGHGLDQFRAEVQALERLGFDTVWLSDIPLGGGLDPIVGLSFAAAATSSLKLGANIVPLGRNPLTLAKSLAQIDQLSAGRLLLSFVVGIDQPGERLAMGSAGANRGAQVDGMIPLLRAWWSGAPVTHDDGRYRYDDIASPGLSYQQPLEVWFGGSGPSALARTGRLADGWLGSAMSPPEAKVARERIEAAATEAGRTIDPEHFGLSIPYAAREPDARTLDLLRARRPDADLADLVPVGPDRLLELLARHVDAGLSKFVVRPIGPGPDTPAGPGTPAGAVDGSDLGRLADLLLPLQT
jgi:probable F420-dependent oxidoreductase